MDEHIKPLEQVPREPDLKTVLLMAHSLERKISRVNDRLDAIEDTLREIRRGGGEVNSYGSDEYDWEL